MLLYRVASKLYAADLSGRGAQMYGGRWNPKGLASLYTAESPSQALLEFLPHFPGACVPDDLMLVTINAPDDLSIYEIPLGGLPVDWDAKPTNPLTISLGRDWLLKCDTAAMRVPSVMLPLGKAWNLVLNPMHPQHGKLTVVEVTEISLDPRLIKT
jgi:RES domain-containing protein